MRPDLSRVKSSQKAVNNPSPLTGGHLSCPRGSRRRHEHLVEPGLQGGLWDCRGKEAPAGETSPTVLLTFSGGYYSSGGLKPGKLRIDFESLTLLPSTEGSKV